MFQGAARPLFSSSLFQIHRIHRQNSGIFLEITGCLYFCWGMHVYPDSFNYLMNSFRGTSWGIHSSIITQYPEILWCIMWDKLRCNLKTCTNSVCLYVWTGRKQPIKTAVARARKHVDTQLPRHMIFQLKDVFINWNVKTIKLCIISHFDLWHRSCKLPWIISEVWLCRSHVNHLWYACLCNTCFR